MRIGVIMPCQARVGFARTAIESILSQTHRDLEIVVVDDAGPEETTAYLRSVADPRLRVVRNATAQGIAGSLNLALAQLHTEWVCRMDADDIAAPHRLASQAAFAASHPEVAVFGSNVTLFGAVDHQGQSHMRVPLAHEDIAYRLLWSNALNHPTVMFRREVVQRAGGYDDSHYCSEDYDLWTRLILHHDFANQPDSLLQYRVHPVQASSLKGERKAKDVSRSRRRYHESLIGIIAPAIFANPSVWNAESHPRLEDWPEWLEFLRRTKATFELGHLGERECESLNVDRDLARRLYRCLKQAHKLSVPVPKEARTCCRELSPWYALSKGVW